MSRSAGNLSRSPRVASGPMVRTNPPNQNQSFNPYLGSTCELPHNQSWSMLLGSTRDIPSTPPIQNQFWSPRIRSASDLLPTSKTQNQFASPRLGVSGDLRTSPSPEYPSWSPLFRAAETLPSHIDGAVTDNGAATEVAHGEVQTSSSLIALDIDDVLLDMRGGFRRFFQDNFPHIPVPIDPMRYVGGDASNLLWKGFLESDIFSDLPVVPGAVDAVQRLHIAGYRLEAVTARSASLRQMTQDNLDRKFPGMVSKIHFTSGQPKGHLCKCLGTWLLVDDSLENVKDVVEHGMSAVLFGDFPWNQAKSLPSNIVRHDQWADAVECIMKHGGCSEEFSEAHGESIAPKVNSSNGEKDEVDTIHEARSPSKIIQDTTLPLSAKRDVDYTTIISKKVDEIKQIQSRHKEIGGVKPSDTIAKVSEVRSLNLMQKVCQGTWLRATGNGHFISWQRAWHKARAHSMMLACQRVEDDREWVEAIISQMFVVMSFYTWRARHDESSRVVQEQAEMSRPRRWEYEVKFVLKASFIAWWRERQTAQVNTVLRNSLTNACAEKAVWFTEREKLQKENDFLTSQLKRSQDSFANACAGKNACFTEVLNLQKENDLLISQVKRSQDNLANACAEKAACSTKMDHLRKENEFLASQVQRSRDGLANACVEKAAWVTELEKLRKENELLTSQVKRSKASLTNAFLERADWFTELEKLRQENESLKVQQLSSSLSCFSYVVQLCKSRFLQPWLRKT